MPRGKTAAADRQCFRAAKTQAASPAAQAAGAPQAGPEEKIWGYYYRYMSQNRNFLNAFASVEKEIHRVFVPFAYFCNKWSKTALFFRNMVL
jgi:hypothetical protein